MLFKADNYYNSEELKQLKLENESALKKLTTHLQVRVGNYENTHNTKIVEHYNGRIKKIESATKKLSRKMRKVSITELKNTLHDMVGVRLVCPFLDDVYELVDLIKQSNIIEVYEIKDYIKEPKESGYRSCHILVGIPVKLGNETKIVKGEIQIRTLAMDAWAAVEHRIKYKPTIEEQLTHEEKRMLKVCAKAFQALEQYMRGLVPKDKKVKKNYIQEVKGKLAAGDEEIKKLNFKYGAALKILKTSLQVDIDNYEMINSTKIVEHFNERIKSPNSAINKLNKKNYNISIEELENNLHDIVGVRLVCPFLSDVYELVDLIKQNDIIEIYGIKDYIKNPKDSGYQSMHLLVNVPVLVGNEIQKIKAEIQIRTLAMDAWAAMEDRIKYLEENEDLTDQQKTMLKICASSFREIDEYMNGLVSKNKISTNLEDYFDDKDRNSQSDNKKLSKRKF